MNEQNYTLKKTEKLNKTFVTSGELHVSNEEEIIWTVLGSCITIIFYIESKKTTFFSHAPLPIQDFSKDACTENCPKPCFKIANDTNEHKFVSCTARFMIDKLQKMRVAKNDVKIYLLGGSTAFNIRFNNGKSIGERNIEVARKLLKELRIPINEHVGGKASRKVSFNTSLGSIKIEQS